ncbi:probable calcium-binding protein CML44 [Prosopis cineraria]|uniref:probable calcium-binding protein CML44 n=1 Tax=Prosopis cineraria TaxID=364024 RepID=UPI00240FC921|nr:probable calcium-binding protein CML44 [Prosopis cineraria]
MCSLTRNDLRRIFEKLDENSDGHVSLENINRLLENTGFHFVAEEVESLVGKKKLDLDEFLKFYESMSSSGNSRGGDEEEEEELVKAFEVFDMDGDGFISGQEVECVLKRLGLWDPRSCKDCASMICLYDTNLDGVLDFHEFKNMMLLTIP